MSCRTPRRSALYRAAPNEKPRYPLHTARREKYKAGRRAYTKAYNKKNKKAVRAAARAYDAAHKEKARERARRRWEAKHEEIFAKQEVAAEHTRPSEG